MPKIWLDVEDMFDYAGVMSRPSGIQRLSFELYAAMRQLAGDRVGFFRMDRRLRIPVVIPWEQLSDTYLRLVNAPSEPRLMAAPADAGEDETARVNAAGQKVSRGLLARVGARFPIGLRTPLTHAAEAQVVAFRHLAIFLSNLWKGVKLRLNRFRPSPATVDVTPVAAASDHAQPLSDAVRRGDFILALGSPWSDPNFAERKARLRAENGLKFGIMIYDLIPLVRPEFCDRTLVSLFDRFLRASLPLTDLSFAISHATANDVAARTRKLGIPMQGPVHVLPIGTGFTPPKEGAPLPEGLTDGAYVLFVSTIEARKNHVLAFRAWRRLTEELPADQVPTLVFAGRVGWMIADLLDALRNSRHLDGKIRIVSDADDMTLASLYRGARFTIFPSLYEGWGLPVTESLGYGKVCIASSSTSIPEAGGDFCLYHDPDNVTEAFELYRKAITEPEIIKALERKIAAEYRPKEWRECAAALLAAVDAAAEATPEVALSAR